LRHRVPRFIALVAAVTISAGGSPATVAQVARAVPVAGQGAAARPDAPAAQAQRRAAKLEHVFQDGGAVGGVVVDGRYAYVGVGPRLEVYDLRAPGGPRRLWRSGPLNIVIGRMVLAGGRIYAIRDPVGSNGRVLTILDVRDPASPRIESQTVLGLVSRGIRGLQVHGATVYLAAGTDGVVIVDAGDPAAPREIGRLLPVTPAGSRCDVGAVHRIGDTLFVGSRGAPQSPMPDGWQVAVPSCDLAAVDVATPAGAKVLAAFPSVGMAQLMAVDAGRMYVVASPPALHVLDVTDPSAPALLGGSGQVVKPRPYEVHLSGTVAYILSYQQGLSIVDVSDPANIREERVVPLPGTYALGFDLDGSTAVVALADRLAFVDMDDPTAYRTTFPVYPIGSHVTLDHLYVAGVAGLFRVFALDDPAAPALVGETILPGSLRNVDVDAARRLAFVAAGDAGLRVVDVGDAARPKEIGHVDAIGFVEAVLSDRSHVYLGTGQTGELLVVDVATPDSPRVVGRLVIPWPSPTANRGIWGLYVSGGLAYVAGNNDVAFVNVVNPAEPKMFNVHSFSAGTFPDDLTLVGAHLFVPTTGGLQILNVANPDAPVAVGRLSLPGQAQSVEVEGDRAYVAAFFGGLHLVDISDYANPVLLDTFRSPGNTNHVSVARGLAYFSDTGGGLAAARAVAGVPATPTVATPSPTMVPTASPTTAPAITPTPPPLPTETATPPAAPSATPDDALVRCVCEAARARVPAEVVAGVVRHPERVSGWRQPRDPGKPAGPYNPLRMCLSIVDAGRSYHPLFNGLAFKVGCP